MYFKIEKVGVFLHSVYVKKADEIWIKDLYRKVVRMFIQVVSC